MEFRNHTPFPALAFEGIDQHDQQFHVVALRQTLTWDESGALRYADEQAPLCEADAYFGEINASAVRQESDLCQYKPRCDVIVNATAHAPGGEARRRFRVGLRLVRPDIAVALPEPPQGLNPLQPARFEDRQAWKVACELARNSRRPGAVLVDKTLVVIGERWFVRRLWPLRLLATLAKWLLTLGLLRLPTWRLSRPRQTASVPLRNDLAFGGQCRIDAEDKAAKRIGKRHRLKPEQQAAFPGAAALDGFAPNPVGRGWARDWYLKAARLKRLPATQVEHPGRPITARHFAKARASKLDDKTGTALLAGFGVRPKGHPERAKFVGTVDDAFVKSDAWLPEDFDFAVWNAAWPDQQTDFLQGNEVIELMNLCAPDTPGATARKSKDTWLRLTLPGDECQVRVRLATGEVFQHPMKLDTVVVEPEERHLSLVWRAVLAKDEDVEIRAAEAWLLTAQGRQQLREKIERIKANMPAQSAEASNGEDVVHA